MKRTSWFTFSGHHDDYGAVMAEVFLISGAPNAELVVTRNGAMVWMQLMEIAEIAMFHAQSLHDRTDLIELYMDEVINNIAAAGRL